MIDGTTTSTITKLISAPTALMILLSVGPLPRSLPERLHPIPTPQPEMVSYVNSGGAGSVRIYSMVDQVEVLSSFVNRLIAESTDLKPEVVQVVNDNFWELF